MASTYPLLSRRDGKKSLKKVNKVNKLPRESRSSGSHIILQWTLISLKDRDMGKS
jgi:hypothetical protein